MAIATASRPRIATVFWFIARFMKYPVAAREFDDCPATASVAGRVGRSTALAAIDSFTRDADTRTSFPLGFSQPVCAADGPAHAAQYDGSRADHRNCDRSRQF